MRRPCALGLLLSLAPAPALASEPPEAAPPRERGGLFLRVSAGPALHLSQSQVRFAGGDSRTRVAGPAIDGHALLGWWFPQGFAMTLGLSTLALPPGQRIQREESSSPLIAGRSQPPLGSTPAWARAYLAGIGVSLPLDDDRIYLQGLIGYALLPDFRVSGVDRNYAGVGLSVGLGYDLWRVSGLRAGLLGQGQLLGLRDPTSAGNGNDDVSASVVAASLMASLSFF